MSGAAARRIGLFGGSFDPVHNAHVALAKSALETLELDELRWIPTGHAWHKDRVLTPAVHRLAMLRCVVAGEPRYLLDPIETERAGPSYTLDTVRALAAREPQAVWWLVIGNDQYATLHTWRDWRELLGRVGLAVANRPGERPAVDPEVLAFPHRTVPLPMMDISSTEVRRRIAEGADFGRLVPPEVARYIERHGLYRPATGS